MGRLTKILFISVIIIASIFESYNALARTKRKPKWISERPINKEYYIGIGKANKKTNSEYIQTAKNNALADIISEISVIISSNSILHQLDDKSGYKEKYEAQIQTSIKDDIENYEIVDSWENKEEYWVYYRLSKAEYKRRKLEKLERAKSLSKDFYEKAQEAEKSFDINNALIYYIKAFESIEKHLGEDLSTFTFDGKIFLDNAIFKSIQDIFSRISIVPEKELFIIKALSENEPIKVKVKFNTKLETQNLANIPLIFYFPDLNIKETERVVTLNNGKAICTIANMTPKGKTQIIRAEFNIDNYFQNNSENSILKNILFEKGAKPYGNINIEVKELFAYLESEEKIWGNLNKSQPITQLFKEELSENFFSFTNDLEKADVIIKIKSEIKEGTKLDKHNLHTVFLNCNISIKSINNNLIIFNQGFNDLKGIKSGSFEIAAKDAVFKAEQKIKTEIIPDIRKIKL